MKRKPNPTEDMRKKCVTKAKDISKTIAGYKCEHCGCSRKNEFKNYQMHGSHIYPEGVYRSMSADVDNILCLCANCHTGGFFGSSSSPSWHEDPVYFSEWFRDKYPERFKILKERSRVAQQMGLYEWTNKYEELKKQYNELTKNK